MFIPHDDARLFAVSFGSGPRTILAIGGWAGSWELWTLPFGELSASWRTAAYDHRGTGTTIAPVESITQEALVSDIFAVMDALHIEKCVLAGESAGAASVLQAALQQPERFSGLVLVDGMIYRPASAGADPFLLGLQHQYEATIAGFVDACVPEPAGEMQRHWGRQILMRSPQAAAIQLYQCMAGIDLRPRLHEITQPTLILHGEDDRIVPADLSRWMAAQIPNNHLEIFAGTGHVPTVTRPADVAAAINRYFAEWDV